MARDILLRCRLLKVDRDDGRARDQAPARFMLGRQGTSSKVICTRGDLFEETLIEKDFSGFNASSYLPPRPILHRLCQMRGLDPLRARQISNSSRQLERAVIRPCALRSTPEWAC